LFATKATISAYITGITRHPEDMVSEMVVFLSVSNRVLILKIEMLLDESKQYRT